MTSFEDARELIRTYHQALQPIEMSLADTIGFILAEDVISRSDQPRFDNTAIDGYAFRFTEGRNSFRVVGEVAAGNHFEQSLAEDECVRIFTGAMMPQTADTAVMQEFVQRDGDIIVHEDDKLKKGGNVRCQGEELKAGDLLLSKGTRLNASAIGLLAACGVDRVNVYRNPKVFVIITGSEFTTTTNRAVGKIFNSNGPMLHAALQAEGLHAEVLQVEDDVDALRSAFTNALVSADMVISTGGVSVGNHDHVRSVAESVGVETKLHKVAQKPGKPMYFGTKGDKLFFGLPGNPRSVMIGYWIHVLPVIRAMRGNEQHEFKKVELPLGEELKLRGNRTEMLAVNIRDEKAYVARKQNSHMLSTLVDADGIAIVPPEHRLCKEGLVLPVYILDNSGG